MTTDLWRRMTADDLAAVGALAERIHPAFPEDDAVFAERLRLYPDGCHVLACDGVLAAYVVSHPWGGGPPALNSLLGELPLSPSTFYIHDLALAPEARGRGAASEIVARLATHARGEGLPTMALVAVNGSEGFWRRHGFAAHPDPALERKLASYGDDARFMTRAL